MTLSDLYDHLKSGVVHINYVTGSDRVGSGSAFMSAGYLITNHHVFTGPPNSTVILRFHDSDPDNLTDGLVLPYPDFQACLKTGSDQDNFDYAVLEVPGLSGKPLHQFEFGDPQAARIGEEIVFLGYPLEHLNLTCHRGIISSFFQTGLTRILQLDASVNQSNSGGPLVDPKSGKVIGIITRKATGLSKMFQELRAALEKNIEALKQSKGIIGIGGLDPVSALVASQYQIGHLTQEIERSANVGIGYAFSVEHVLADNLLVHLA